MLIGAHISAEGGFVRVLERGHEIGAECVQFFTSSPKGGRGKKDDENTREKFRIDCADFFKRSKQFGIFAAYVHTAYFINLASKNNRIFYGSVSAIRKDLEAASMLGAHVVTHIGSARDFKDDEYSSALLRAKEGLEKILDGYDGAAELILENSAGAGKIIGSDLSDMEYFLRSNKKIGGICFDTAHAFESGVDLSGGEKMSVALDVIGGKVGLDKLKLIHLNDSKTPLGSHRDRHEHLGKGMIGLPAFEQIVKDPRMKEKNFILETPTKEGVIEDLAFLRGVRK